MATVTLKSKVGPFMTHAELPNGKPFEVVFKEKVRGSKEFFAEVPTVVSYKDDFNNTRVFHDNYAEFLVNAYPDEIELVEVVEDPVVKETVALHKDKRGPGRPRKE